MITEKSTTAAQKRVEERYQLYRLMKGASQHRITAELRSIDSQVKSHEQAHMAVLGGAAASGIQYDYVRGPNGRLYAVGGSH